MELPGTVIGEQVLDLLADPPVPDLTGHHNAALCEIAEHLTHIQRAVTVAQWRELDEMVTREGTRRAVDITSDWLHAHSALLLSDARATVVTAVRMCASPSVLQAFADGQIGEREARYIVEFIAAPPKDMYTKPAADTETDGDADAAGDAGVGIPMTDDEREQIRGQVRDYLLFAAASHDMRVLKAGGESLRDILSHEINPGDDIDRNALDINHYGKGRVHLTGDLDTETGENLLRALQPFMDRRPEFDGSEDKRSNSRRRADALAEWARRSQPIPDTDTDTDDSATDAESAEPSGSARTRGAVVQPRINIHIPLELLFGDIPTHAQACQMILDGRIDEVFERTGRSWMTRMGYISLAAAKRLACDCELTMIGADLHGAPLTVDTGKRFASKKHRIALEYRDKGCAFPNCDRPADWTQAHHTTPWEMRHQTQIDGLCLLCTAHHVAVHHQGWEVMMSRTRFPVFRPPVKIDPLRRWLDGNGNHTVDPPNPESFFRKTA